MNEGIQPMYLKQEDVINSQKPIYDFTKDEEPDMDVIDMYTLAEIKNLAKINLSADQKKQLTIVGLSDFYLINHENEWGNLTWASKKKYKECFEVFSEYDLVDYLKDRYLLKREKLEAQYMDYILSDSSKIR